MPRNVPDAFIAEKNALTNAPIWLYRVNRSDTPTVEGEEDWFLAEYPENVAYFKDINTAQTYLAFPLRHGGIHENGEGRIDSLEVTVANVSREIQYELETRDGLRGRKVTIRQVFADHLDDPAAYIEDIFYIDAVAANEQHVTFTLTSKLDVLDIQLPYRRFTRDFCPWTYKGEGCWVSDGGGGWTPPSDFSSTMIKLYTAERSDTGNPASTRAKFHAVDCSGLSRAAGSADYVSIDLKCSNPAAMTAAGKIQISSKGIGPEEPGGGECWQYTNLTGLGVTTGWKTFALFFRDFSMVTSELAVSRINYVRWYQPFASGNHTIYWKNASIYRLTPYNFALTDADTCNKTLRDCRRHNNQRRFGGFPSVPTRRVFRG